MRQLFIDIRTKLEAAIPGLYVRMWNDQLSREEDGGGYSWPRPAVFIEFVNQQQPQQLGGGYQIYNELIVRAHIVHEQIDSGNGDIDQNLDALTFAQDVYMVLQKFEPDGAVMFIRVAEEQDYNHSNLYHFIQDYKTNYIDQQRKEPVGGIPAPTPLTLELNIEYDPAPYLKTIPDENFLITESGGYLLQEDGFKIEL